MQEEMKKALENQINEKKVNKAMQREQDKQHLSKMKENDDAFNYENESKKKNEKEKLQVYQNDLKKQLTEKKQKKGVFMDEIEKILNKEIINDIYKKN